MDYEKKAKELLECVPKLKVHKSHVDKMSKGELFMLMHLNYVGGSMLSGDLAKHVEVSTARMAKIIKTTEEKGYVKRKTVENDRRKTKVVLTDKGKKTVEDFYNKALQNTIRFLEYIGPEDTDNLFGLIERFSKYSEEVLCEETCRLKK